MKLYEFTVSDCLGLSLAEIEDIAFDGARHQEDFEIQMGGPHWGWDWRVELERIVGEGPARVYHFVVTKPGLGARDTTEEEERDHLQEALENRESEVEHLVHIHELIENGMVFQALIDDEIFYDE